MKSPAKATCLSPTKKDSETPNDDTTSPKPTKNALSSTKKRRLEAALTKDTPKLLVKLLSEHAVAPKRGSAHAAGYDLASAHEYVIPAQGRALVQTDIAIALPEGTYGRIAPRSGLAVKSGIGVGGGVIDADYRGPVGVCLFNHSDAEFKSGPALNTHRAMCGYCSSTWRPCGAARRRSDPDARGRSRGSPRRNGSRRKRFRIHRRRDGRS